MTNQALLFIKPHAIGNAAACAYIERQLADHGVAVRQRQALTGTDVEAGGMVDRHYAANARSGTCADPAKLPVSAAACDLFAERFGESWDAAVRAGRVVSGLVLQRRLGITGEELNRRWAALAVTKLAGGLYTGWMPDEKVFVLNGFYPSIRELFTRPEARLLLLVGEFDSAALSWQAFRERVIGTTNPAAADPASIRGWLHAHQAETGLAISYRENVIHASASAFEALLEKPIWLPGWEPDRDPLWTLLRAQGFTLGQLETWRVANPLVRLDGRQAGLLDLLEGLDTAPTATLLERLRNEEQLVVRGAAARPANL